MASPAAWAEEKQAILTHWPALDEKELDATKGDRYAIMALLEGRLGYAHSIAQRDLEHVLAGNMPEPKDVADAESHTGTSGPISRQN